MGRGVRPYTTYIGMWRAKGYYFDPFGSEIGDRFQLFWSESLKTGMDFTETGMNFTIGMKMGIRILEAMAGKGFRKITYFGLKLGSEFGEPSRTTSPPKIPSSTPLPLLRV